MWFRTRWTTLAHGARRTEPVQECSGQVGTDEIVADGIGSQAGSAPASDVVDERRQADHRTTGRCRIDGPHRVVPQVLARHLVLGLHSAASSGEIQQPSTSAAGGPTDGSSAASSLEAGVAIMNGGDPRGLHPSLEPSGGTHRPQSRCTRRTVRIIRRASSQFMGAEKIFFFFFFFFVSVLLKAAGPFSLPARSSQQGERETLSTFLTDC